MAQSRPDIREVVFRLSLFNASFQNIDLAGIRYTGGGDSSPLPCPFHEDDTPSFSFNAHSNVYHCFGCDASGTSWDLIGNALFPGVYTWDKYSKEVIEWWKSNPQNMNAIKPLPKRAISKFNEELVQRQVSAWHRSLVKYLHNQNQLKSEFGIYDKDVIEHFKLGYTGLDFKAGSYFSIPHYRSDGKLMGVQRRFHTRKVPDGTNRYWQIAGSKARMIYNGAAIMKKTTDPIFCCEDEWSVLHFAQLGYDAVSIFASLSTKPENCGGIHESWLPILERRTVIIVPDSDDPGMKCGDLRADRIQGSLLSSLPPIDNVKDFADLCRINPTEAKKWAYHMWEVANAK